VQRNGRACNPRSAIRGSRAPRRHRARFTRGIDGGSSSSMAENEQLSSSADVSRGPPCARWRGSHATVGQVGAYGFSSVEFRAFAVSEGDRTGRGRGEGHYPPPDTRRCVRAIPVRGMRPTRQHAFPRLAARCSGDKREPRCRIPQAMTVIFPLKCHSVNA